MLNENTARRLKSAVIVLAVGTVAYLFGRNHGEALALRGPVDGQPPLAEVIASQAQLWIDGVLGYFVLLAAVGTAAMALVELVKSLALLRRRYHRESIRNWFRDCRFHRSELVCMLRDCEWDADAHRELIELVAGTPARADAWYDQPGQAMFSQLDAAIELVLHAPRERPALSRFLELDAGSPVPLEGDAFEREAFRVERLVSMLRVRSDYLWARMNQWSAMGVSFLLLLGFGYTELRWGSLAVTAVLGGLLAPFAKDFVERVLGTVARYAPGT